MPFATVWRLRFGGRRTAWLLLLGLAIPAGIYTSNTLVGRNLHEVLAGRIYRCAQPSAAALESLVARYGIRTVVNLRGCEPLVPCYLEESRASHRLDLEQEDVFFSAYRLPSVKEVRRLVEVLDRAEYPLVLHCRRGADRTGLAAAIAVLMQTDVTPQQAARQLSLRYGHVRLGRPANLDRFLNLYRDWLRRSGKTPSQQVFRQWLQTGYCPGEARCEMQLLEAPTRVRAEDSCVVRVRVRNTSLQTWRLCAGTTAGVHAGFIVLGEGDNWVTNGRAGLYDAQMRPGESRAFTLVVPPLHSPGHYRLLVDMVDEQQCWFFQAGSEPLERELEVVD